MTDLELVQAAWGSREKAIAVYSGYRVGAALLTAAGRMIHGANVESASYGLSLCAERVALFKALTEGERDFQTIAIAAEGRSTVVPCGACRQLLAEYAPQIKILLSGSPGTFETVMISDLLPRPFTSLTFR